MLELIDIVVHHNHVGSGQWVGRASELERLLKRDADYGHEAERLLPHQNSCGAYLSRLKAAHPQRFSCRTLDGRTIWTIQVKGFPAPTAWQKPKIAPEFMARVRAARLKHADEGDKEAST